MALETETVQRECNEKVRYESLLAASEVMITSLSGAVAPDGWI